MKGALEALLHNPDPAVRAQGWELCRSLGAPGALDLRHTSLRGDDMSGLVLRGIDLSEADLAGADLRGADLRGVRLHVPLSPALARHLRFTLWPHTPGLLTMAISYTALCIAALGVGPGLWLAAWSGTLTAAVVSLLVAAPLLVAWPVMALIARHRQLCEARWDATTRFPWGVSVALLHATSGWPRRGGWRDVALAGTYFVSIISKNPENDSE